MTKVLNGIKLGDMTVNIEESLAHIDLGVFSLRRDVGILGIVFSLRFIPISLFSGNKSVTSCVGYI